MAYIITSKQICQLIGYYLALGDKEKPQVNKIN